MFGAFIFFVIISEEARFRGGGIYIKVYHDSVHNLYTKFLAFQEEFSEILP